jgi:hypothetical protein
MGLFHKKLTDALAATNAKDFDKALEILEEHEREDIVFSGLFKDLALDIESYDHSLRIAIAELKSDKKRKNIPARTNIQEALLALNGIKEKLRDLLAEEIKLE